MTNLNKKYYKHFSSNPVEIFKPSINICPSEFGDQWSFNLQDILNDYEKHKKNSHLGYEYSQLINPQPCRTGVKSFIVINAIYGTKEEIIFKIETAGLPPDIIVEHYHGFYLFWNVIFNSKKCKYDIYEMLNMYFGGDRKFDGICEHIELPGVYYANHGYLFKNRCIAFNADTAWTEIDFVEEYVGHNQQAYSDRLAKTLGLRMGEVRLSHGKDKVSDLINSRVPIATMLDYLGLQQGNGMIFDNGKYQNLLVNNSGNYAYDPLADQLFSNTDILLEYGGEDYQQDTKELLMYLEGVGIENNKHDANGD